MAEVLRFTVPPDCGEFAQYLIVEVASDGAVTVKSYDIITGQFFPGCDRVVRPPFTPERRLRMVLISTMSAPQRSSRSVIA